MMIKYHGMLFVFGKLGGDAPAAKTLRFMYVDDSSLYVSSKKGILIIVYPADAFFKNNYRLALFHANVFIYTLGPPR